MKPADPVQRPPHYTSSPAECRDCARPIECIDVAEHFGFSLGNVIKYVWRAGLKGDALEDLRKAAQYLQFEIDRRERLVPSCGEVLRSTDGSTAACVCLLPVHALGSEHRAEDGTGWVTFPSGVVAVVPPAHRGSAA